MIIHNTNRARLAHKIVYGIVGVSLLATLLPVSVNLAQDYSVLSTEPSATEPTPDAAAADSGVVSYDEKLLEDWQQTRTSVLGENLSQLVRLAPNYPQEIATAFARIPSKGTDWSGLRILLTCIAILALGLLGEIFTTRKLLQRLYNYVDSQPKSFALKLKFITTRIAIQLVGLAVLSVITYVCALLLIKQILYLNILFIEGLLAFIQFRLWVILLRNIFAPNRSTLRPITLDDASARQLYHWFIAFFAVLEFSNALFMYFGDAGMSTVLVNGLLVPYTLALNLIILSQVWSMRHKITAMFIGDHTSPQHNYAREFFIHAWPFMFTAWLMLLWMLWLYKAFIGQWDDTDVISKSWWITLAFPIADRLFHRLLENVVHIQWLQSPTFERRARRFINIVQNGFRLLCIGLAVFLFSQAWRAEATSLGGDSFAYQLLSQSINLLVIGTIAYVVWELLNALIERNLPEEETDAITKLEEGDGGGIGKTRAETLLPLMRKVISVILMVFLLLSMLHSLGVAIGPLLAGAGVIGIAIGFGAQKLVQDILSGIFFLVDDAFRLDEYIEIPPLRGTVEKISLRSMQLRHHLGAVQTIPYSEVKTVKNLSRDWITMKLELRLSYDADIEQVRKIIKTVGQEMLKVEGMGADFILPLKSQGVMRVEESALIVRMKFTAIPGKQWVIRREAYSRVRDALAAAGIHFAHREVRVRLPEEYEHDHEHEHVHTPEEKKKLAEAAAAAAGSMLAAEAAKLDKLADIDDDDGDDR